MLRSSRVKKAMSENEIEVLFRTWWLQSYPMPPANHTVRTHVSFGHFLLGYPRDQPAKHQNQQQAEN